MKIKNGSVGFYILIGLVISLASMFIFPNEYLPYRISNAAFSSGVVLFTYGTLKSVSYLKFIGWFGNMGKWKQKSAGCETENLKETLPNRIFFPAIVVGLICIFISVVFSSFSPN